MSARLLHSCGNDNLFSGFFDDLSPRPPPQPPLLPPSSPQAPPATPPPVLPPPFPPAPPLAPGLSFAYSTEALRVALATATTVNLFLPATNRFDLGGAALVVPVGSNVTLSSDGNGATLDGEWLSRVFEVHGNLTLSGLSLTRGRSPPGFAGSLSGGGAIAVASGGSLLLLDCVLSSSTTVTNVTLGDSLFTGAPDYMDHILATAAAEGIQGGALAVAADANAVLVRSTLTNMTSRYGGAISTAGRMTILQSVVTSTSAEFAGAIALSQGELVVLESAISYSHAIRDGGCIDVHPGSQLSMRESSITDSFADEVRTSSCVRAHLVLRIHLRASRFVDTVACT